MVPCGKNPAVEAVLITAHLRSTARSRDSVIDRQSGIILATAGADTQQSVAGSGVDEPDVVFRAVGGAHITQCDAGRAGGVVRRNAVENLFPDGYVRAIVVARYSRHNFLAKELESKVEVSLRPRCDVIASALKTTVRVSDSLGQVTSPDKLRKEIEEIRKELSGVSSRFKV